MKRHKFQSAVDSSICDCGLVEADAVHDPEPGPTGEFPEGQLDENNQGQLRMKVSHDDQLVRIDFGRPTAWIAMNKAQAVTLAFALLDHAGAKIEMKPNPEG